MAQTKRKRQTKHRGTAAGTIKTRGRTGRQPTPEERKKQERRDAKERRLNTPPTWRSSLNRAGIAAVVIFALVLFTTKGKNRIEPAILFAAVMMAIYVPGGYYLELFIFRRRQRQRSKTSIK
ncbi:MAG: hypothetical protein M3Y17_10645 [Actinomycetota bacterium]|nr:hypothetical protein [Actinomycetota bacterium]